MFAENVRSGNVPSSWIIFKVKIDRKSNTEDKCELFQRCVELYGYSRCQLRHPFFLFQVSFMRIFLHFLIFSRVSKYFIFKLVKVFGFKGEEILFSMSI